MEAGAARQPLEGMGFRQQNLALVASPRLLGFSGWCEAVVQGWVPWALDQPGVTPGLPPHQGTWGCYEGWVEPHKQ